MKIGIIGTGAYSIAIASMLNKKTKDITMWTESKERYNLYQQKGYITDIIPNYSSPSNIKLTTSYQEAVYQKDIIFIMTTATYVGSVCKEIKPYINKKTIICIASKGIENNTCKFLSDIAFEELNTKKIAIISGPSFAIDLINNYPVGLSIAAKNKNIIETIKNVLENDTLKLRATKDLIGIQICGSIKNVIAIAAGILNGLNYPESTQSFLITESLHDIKALIVSLGGNPKTILSFAGVGDLLLTCTSTKSRNYTFGQIIGKGATKEAKENYLKNNTVEGYYTLKSIYKLIRRKKIKIPIINLISKIINDTEKPEALANFLINKK